MAAHQPSSLGGIAAPHAHLQHTLSAGEKERNLERATVLIGHQCAMSDLMAPSQE